MDESIVRKNAEIIYNCNDLDHTIFTVDSKGKLDTISKWNLIGRLVHWCHGQLSKESNRERTSRAFSETIEGMISLCDPNTHTKEELEKNYVKLKSSEIEDLSSAHHYQFVATAISRSSKYGDLTNVSNSSKYQGLSTVVQILEKMREDRNREDKNIFPTKFI